MAFSGANFQSLLQVKTWAYMWFLFCDEQLVKLKTWKPKKTFIDYIKGSEQAKRQNIWKMMFRFCVDNVNLKDLIKL